MQNTFTFLPDKVSSVDLFEDKTHEKIAQQIFSLITQSNCDGFPIGLVGEWGSGKSTVVNLLMEKLKTHEDNFVYYVDSWVHEGDHLRRSFLESLIVQVKESGCFCSKDDVEKLDEINKKVSNKIITKEITHTPKPTVMGGLIAGSAFFVPIGTVLIDKTVEEVTFIPGPLHWRFILGLVLTLAPLISTGISFLLSKIFSKINFKLFQNKVNDEITNETSQEEERSSIEFSKFFNDVLKLLGNKKKNFVCVIDNLDRINKDDALKIWSTLQVFLQNKNPTLVNGIGEKGIPKVWIVVPYDENGLGKLWNVANIKPLPLDKNDISKSFFEKAFQLRIDVPNSLFSGWENFAKEQIDKLFNNFEEKEKQQILNVLKWTRKGMYDTPTPREIKTYLNQVAYLNLTLNEKETRISIVSICYFVYLRYLLAMTAAEIKQGLIEGKYPDHTMNLYERKYDIRGELCAILFGITDATKSQQLILLEPVEEALKEENFEYLNSLEETHKNTFYDALELILQKENLDANNFVFCLEKSNADKFRIKNPLMRFITCNHVILKTNIMKVPIENTLALFKVLNEEEKVRNDFLGEYLKQFLKKLKENKDTNFVLENLLKLEKFFNGKLPCKIDYKDLGISEIEKIVIFNKSKQNDSETLHIENYLCNVQNGDEDLYNLLEKDQNNQNLAKIVKIFVGAGQTNLIKTTNKVINIINGAPNSQISTYLDSFLEIANPEIFSVFKNWTFWNYVYCLRNNNSFVKAACLYILYYEKIPTISISHGGDSQSGYSATIQVLSSDLVEYIDFVYEWLNRTKNFNSIWKLLYNHGNILAWKIIEKAISENRSDVFEGITYEDFCNLTNNLCDEYTDIATNYFLEKSDFYSKIESTDENISLISSPKAALLCIKNTKKEIIKKKILSELEKLNKVQWLENFSKKSECLDIVEYLAEGDSINVLQNDYQDAFVSYIENLIKNNQPCAIKEKLNFLYCAMPVAFKEEFSKKMVQVAFDAGFVFDDSVFDFMQICLDTPFLFSDRHEAFFDMIKDSIEQKNIAALKFIISLLEKTGEKFKLEDRYSAVLKQPLAQLKIESPELADKFEKFFKIITEEKNEQGGD